MKKLALQLDDLQVDTFQTSAVSADRGTVVGNAPTNMGNTCAVTCRTCGIVPQTQNCRADGNTHDCHNCV
jgi:predicted RNA-binding Zn-ribbon protein involved in translation (DUF1610 family)